MANRAMRRRVMRYEQGKYQKELSQMKIQQINERLLQQGIGQQDIDQARREGLNEGRDLAGKIMSMTCYAAAILTLKRHFDFNDEQLFDFLCEMDWNVLTVLDHQEMIQETLDETGIEIKWDECMDRVQRKGSADE